MERKTIRITLLILSFVCTLTSFTQEKAHFRNTRLINSHNTEVLEAGVMEFKISHRFGSFDGGFNELFGLDQATMRIAFEQGISSKLMVGLGRSTFNKTFDGFVKYKLSDQSQGAPLSSALFTSTNITGVRFDNTRTNYFSSRISYVSQLILSKKFKEFTLQLSPTVVHQNLVTYAVDKNLNYALGYAAKYNISKIVSINGEYIVRFRNGVNTSSFDNYFNSMAVGVGINTKGHFFELNISNSFPMYEQGFIQNTTGDISKGQLHLGFNLIRDFKIWKPKK